MRSCGKNSEVGLWRSHDGALGRGWRFPHRLHGPGGRYSEGTDATDVDDADNNEHPPSWKQSLNSNIDSLRFTAQYISGRSGNCGNQASADCKFYQNKHSQLGLSWPLRRVTINSCDSLQFSVTNKARNIQCKFGSAFRPQCDQIATYTASHRSGAVGDDHEKHVGWWLSEGLRAGTREGRCRNFEAH